MSVKNVLLHNGLSFSQKCRFIGLFARTAFDKRFFETVKVILGLLTTDHPVIVDIGANVGNFSKAVAKQSSRGCTILAIEPSIYVHSILAFFARGWSKGAADVRCRKIALAEGNGEVTLQTPVKSSGSLRVGLAHIGKTRQEIVFSETVPSTTLDEILQTEGLQNVHLVKLDVEGAEALVLKGAQRLFWDVRPLWFVEIDDCRAKSFGGSGMDLFGKFQAGGYRAFVFDDVNMLTEVEEPSASADYLFVHRKSVLAQIRSEL